MAARLGDERRQSSARTVSSTRPTAQVAAVSHSEPTHYLELYFDGGSRGNPGISGAGATVTYVAGDVRHRVIEVVEYVADDSTNNVAEYTGLIRGLEEVRDILAPRRPPPPLRVFGDSLLIVKQVNGEFECKAAVLEPLMQRAEALVDGLEEMGCVVSLSQLPRAQNAEADALGNEAMDTKTSRVEVSPDFELIMSLMQNQPKPPDDTPASEAKMWWSQPNSIVPRLVSLPDADDPSLIGLLKQLHTASRPLKRLSHAKLWPTYMKASWAAECKRFTPVLKQALDSEDDLQLTQALLDLLELPTMALSRFLPKPHHNMPREARRDFKHPDPPGSEKGGHPTLRTATSLAHQDLPGKAMQVLASPRTRSKSATSCKTCTPAGGSRSGSTNPRETRSISHRKWPNGISTLKLRETRLRSAALVGRLSCCSLYVVPKAREGLSHSFRSCRA